MKKIIMVVFMSIFALNFAYASENVKVNIPEFSTEINDVVFDNIHEKYPLIVHKDITYFPMTYKLCREMGVAVDWHKDKGLYIANYTSTIAGHEVIPGNNKKGVKYDAVIVNYPITLNGKKVDNLKEEYPILNFRDITYFPMTWKFINDEFGWEINWNEKDGLKINSYNNGNETKYLKELNNDYAIIQKSITEYEEVKNENGEIQYNNKGNKLYDYKLDFATDTLTKVGEVKEIKEYNFDEFEVISEQFSVKGNAIIYNGKEIFEAKGLDANKDKKVFAKKWSFGNENIIGVELQSDISVPAPYTPRKHYVFLEKDNVVSNIENWNELYELQKVYKVDKGYYLCSNNKYIEGRWYNTAGIVMLLGNDSKLSEIKYDEYGSLTSIGVKDNNLYVLATWYPNNKNASYIGEINLINDGYYYIDDKGELNKVSDFIYGDTFMAPNGNLYCIRKNEIINLSNGNKVEFN